MKVRNTKIACGTPSYLPPEKLLRKVYGKEGDIWALGVLFYRMLVGKLPFRFDGKVKTEKIMRGPIDYPRPLYENLGDLSEKLIALSERLANDALNNSDSVGDLLLAVKDLCADLDTLNCKAHKLLKKIEGLLALLKPFAEKEQERLPTEINDLYAGLLQHPLQTSLAPLRECLIDDFSASLNSVCDEIDDVDSKNLDNLPSGAPELLSKKTKEIADGLKNFIKEIPETLPAEAKSLFETLRPFAKKSRDSFQDLPGGLSDNSYGFSVRVKELFNDLEPLFESCEPLSGEARELISMLLEKDPSKRIALADVLEHQLMRKYRK